MQWLVISHTVKDHRETYARLVDKIKREKQMTIWLVKFYHQSNLVSQNWSKIDPEVNPTVTSWNDILGNTTHSECYHELTYAGVIMEIREDKNEHRVSKIHRKK